MSLYSYHISDPAVEAEAATAPAEAPAVPDAAPEAEFVAVAE